jgi:fatty acid desaturase
MPTYPIIMLLLLLWLWLLCFIIYILRNFVIFCQILKHKQSIDQPYEEKVSRNLERNNAQLNTRHRNFPYPYLVPYV